MGVTGGDRGESSNPPTYASVASDSRPRMGASGNRVDGHSHHQGEDFSSCQLAFLIFDSKRIFGLILRTVKRYAEYSILLIYRLI